jgi:RES domain-containing protein
MAETLAFAIYYQLPVHVSMPRTFVAIEFDLGAVLDLTTGRNRQSLGISEQRLLECDWRREAERGDVPLTQAVGRSAHQTGLEGILVRSAADPTGRNLVVFVENLRPESSLRVVSADQLGMS